MIPNSKLNKFPKRLSVDAGLNPQVLFSTKLKRQSMAVSREIYRQLPSIPSKSNLSQDDGYQTLSKKILQIDTHKEIKTVFDRLSTRQGVITIQVIQNCLIQLGQDPKYAVDMIQLLDFDNQGYIDQKTFLSFFLKRPNGASTPSIPQSMEKKAEIVRFITEKNKALKSLENVEFCERVMKQFCKSQSKQKITNQN